MTISAGEVPERAVSDSVIVWSQPLVTTGLLVMSLLTASVAGHGAGLLALVLIAVCAVHAYSRSVPDRLVPDRVRLLAAVIGVVAAGLLFGVASASWAVSFAYVVTGHVGYRFVAETAVGLSILTAVVALVTLETGPHSTDDVWSWWTALTVVGPVATGLARQNRLRTLANARELVSQTRRAAASEAEASALAERNRIARELHDVLAHSLSGVSLQLDTADALIEAGRVDEGRASIQAARGLAVDGLVQARDAVRALREDAIDLAASLQQSVQGQERLDVTGDLSTVDPEVARAALRIVQEALTNARRHAPGADTRVEMRLADELTLRITNAAPPEAVAPFGLGGGQGLVGMRERAASLGGTLTAGPARGGWEVVATIPVSGR